MILLKEKARPILRAAVLGAVAIAGLAACTRSEVTEVNCVEVAEEHPESAGQDAIVTRVCDQRQVRLVYRDEFSEPEVVKDETW